MFTITRSAMSLSSQGSRRTPVAHRYRRKLRRAVTDPHGVGLAIGAGDFRTATLDRFERVRFRHGDPGHDRIGKIHRRIGIKDMRARPGICRRLIDLSRPDASAEIAAPLNCPPPAASAWLCVELVKLDMAGVIIVGVVPNTKAPLPVSLEMTPARLRRGRRG